MVEKARGRSPEAETRTILSMLAASLMRKKPLSPSALDRVESTVVMGRAKGLRSAQQRRRKSVLTLNRLHSHGLESWLVVSVGAVVLGTVAVAARVLGEDVPVEPLVEIACREDAEQLLARACALELVLVLDDRVTALREELVVVLVLVRRAAILARLEVLRTATHEHINARELRPRVIGSDAIQEGIDNFGVVRSATSVAVYGLR